MVITLSRKNNEKPKVQNFLNGNTIGSRLKMQIKDSINSNGNAKSHLSNMQKVKAEITYKRVVSYKARTNARNLLQRANLKNSEHVPEYEDSLNPQKPSHVVIVPNGNAVQGAFILGGTVQ